MRIIFQKGIDGPDVLTCHRKDDSICETVLSYGSAYHDLAHFVVESKFALTEGIWGKISEGYAFDEYNLPNETRPFPISPQGYQAEFLATLVQSAVPTGEISEFYLQMLRDAATTSGIPFPEMPAPSILSELIAQAKVLTQQWEALKPGDFLELKF
jgi:hypothetical protein